MALFKINRGSEKNLPAGITDGYAYFCTDNQNFYIDFIDSSGVSTRKKLSVEFAEKLRYLKDDAYVEIDASNVPQLSGDNTFTGTNTFNGIVNIGEGTTLNPTGLHTIKNDCNFEGSVNILNGITLTDTSVEPQIDFNISVGETCKFSCLNHSTGVPHNMSFENSVLKELGTPIDDTDAANKKYVDDNISTCVPKNTVSSETWTFTLADGSTVTKNIVLSSSL